MKLTPWTPARANKSLPGSQNPGPVASGGLLPDVSNRPRPRQPLATVRELVVALRSIGKEPPAPSERIRRRWRAVRIESARARRT
jgi:hypothetical protein